MPDAESSHKPTAGRRTTRVITTLVCLAAVALAVYLFLAPPPKAQAVQESGPPPPVLTEQVSEAVWDQTVRALGTVRANEQAMLSPKITERIIKVNFESGQRVKKGELLIELNDAEQRAQLQEMQASLDESTRQLERVRSVEGSGALSRSVIDEEISRHDKAEAQLELARSRIDDRRIHAPFDGMLGLRDISPGELVESGDDLVEILDLTPVKVDFTIPERYFSQVEPGLEIIARAEAYPDRIFTGEVRYISPQIDPVSRAARVRAFIANEDYALRPGMLLLVELNLGSQTAITVSESALSPIGDQQYIFRVSEENTAERVPVKIGRRQKGEVEILEGLEPGQTIVTHGHRARSGAPVKVLTEAEVFANTSES